MNRSLPPSLSGVLGLASEVEAEILRSLIFDMALILLPVYMLSIVPIVSEDELLPCVVDMALKDSIS